MGLEHVARGLGRQPVAALGAQRRGQDDVRGPVAGEGGGDGGGDVGAAEQADLDGIHPDIGEDGFDLLGDEVGLDELDAGHAAGVLGREGGDGGHGIAPLGADGLEVRLDAGAAAGVGAGDAEDVPDTGVGHGCSRRLR